MRLSRLIVFLLGLIIILICAYTILMHSPWANTVNVLITVAGLTISFAQLLFRFPIGSTSNSVGPSLSAVGPISPAPSFHTPNISPKTPPTKTRFSDWTINKTRLITMLTGTIFCAGLVLFIQTLAIKYDRNYMGIDFNTFLSIFYVLVYLTLGATFGPWVGLVVACGSELIGGFAYYYFNFGQGLGDSLHFAYILWPFYLSSIAEGFVIGLALILTSGEYKSLKSLAIAECLCLLAMIAQVAVINTFILNPSPFTLQNFFTFDTSVEVIVFPFLLFSYNAIIGKR